MHKKSKFKLRSLLTVWTTFHPFYPSPFPPLISPPYKFKKALNMPHQMYASFSLPDPSILRVSSGSEPVDV